jgi:hypothetical protein
MKKTTPFNMNPRTTPMRQVVDEEETKIEKAKLQLEVQQLRQREVMYEVKRQELIDLEAQYRKSQST